ncbi:Wzz/FepE/Etk N-terminal domain-containing protein [Nonomuraea sp. NPDC048916]|uniref:Wzz/FepE/Etk N-terminal domain-containing protein n=1 Tax=Nonomuraea sp. NPDC048916 TaxID=3154232 RepID=UPI0033DB47FB
MSLSPDFPARRSGTDLGEHFALLRRRWQLFLGFVLAGGTAGLALLWIVPSAYTATTQVLVTAVGPQEQGNQVTNRQREPLNLDTEAQIAQSALVTAKAAELLHTSEPEPVEVTVPPNSAVLSISVTAPGPATAATQSRAYAEAYLAVRADAAQAAITLQQKAMLAKLKQVNTDLDTVVRELPTLPAGTAEHTLAQHRQGVLNRQAYNLTMKYDALKTLTVTPGSILSQAVPPEDPSSPSLPLYLGTGLMLGLLAGTAAAVFRDRIDTRLRTACDVERLTRLPVIADLPARPDQDMLHNLASTVIAGCQGKRLLIKAVPNGFAGPAVAEALAATTMLTVLDGSDVGDLARADAAVLVVGLDQVTSAEATAAIRPLARQHVPIIGVVTATREPVFCTTVTARSRTSLGKLVAGAELDPGIATETTPMQALPHPPGKLT